MESGELRRKIALALRIDSGDVSRLTPLSGGCIASVYRVELVRPEPTGGHERVVVKADDGHARRGDGVDLRIEGEMLRYLGARSSLPVPEVLVAERGLLVMEHIDTRPVTDRRAAERHAGELLAALHSIGPDTDGHDARGFGFDHDTLIGPLRQPNPWNADWVSFFREQRLMHFARDAAAHRTLPARTLARMECLADELEDLLVLPAGVRRRASLVHGDAWSGNILMSGDRVAAFIDPACHFADAEVELAFITLFGSLGRDCFERYAECRPEWSPAMGSFFERRRDVYNLYPLLVHTRLFGGGYAEQVSATLDRLGF